MTLTKREALEHCRDQWAWMAKTGEGKDAYFDAEEVPEDERPAGLCWCCEYACDQVEDDIDCDMCPLSGYAWDDQCLSSGSVYYEWVSTGWGSVEDGKRHAASIVCACEWALSELEEGE